MMKKNLRKFIFAVVALCVTQEAVGNETATQRLVGVLESAPGMTALPKIAEIYQTQDRIDGNFNEYVTQYLCWGKINNPESRYAWDNKKGTIPPSPKGEYFISKTPANKQGFGEYFDVFFAAYDKQENSMFCRIDSYFLNDHFTKNAPVFVTKTHIPALYVYSNIAKALCEYYDHLKEDKSEFTWKSFLESKYGSFESLEQRLKRNNLANVVTQKFKI